MSDQRPEPLESLSIGEFSRVYQRSRGPSPRLERTMLVRLVLSLRNRGLEDDIVRTIVRGVLTRSPLSVERQRLTLGLLEALLVPPSPEQPTRDR
jgi:hypothetical protein